MQAPPGAPPAAAAAAQQQGMPEYDESSEPSFGVWLFTQFVESSVFKQSQQLIQQRNEWFQSIDNTIQQHPWTAAFVSTLGFGALYFTNSTLCSQKYPQPFLDNPASPLGKKILNGRKVRKELGGRPFYRYVQDMAALGVSVNEAKFRAARPPFVDEKEWFELTFK